MTRIELLRLIRGWLYRRHEISSLKAAQDTVQMMEDIGLIYFYNETLRPTDMLCDGGVPYNLDDVGMGWHK